MGAYRARTFICEHDRVRAEVTVGTCNWSDHEGFYPKGLPPGRRLEHYARFFPIVEVDSSYYAIPPTARTATWAEVTPANFRFNVKAFRSLTYHEREGDRPREPTSLEVERFLACLEPLREAGKLVAVHYQFPPWYTRGAENLERLERIRARHPDDLLVFEFRHRSWAQPEADSVVEVLRRQAVSLCLVDEPQLGEGSFPRLVQVTDPRLVVVRFHGRNRATWYAKGRRSGDRFDYLYSREELADWVPSIARLAETAARVQLLFNNNRANYAVINGLQMAELLHLGYPPPEESLAATPPLFPGDGAGATS